MKVVFKDFVVNLVPFLIPNLEQEAALVFLLQLLVHNSYEDGAELILFTIAASVNQLVEFCYWDFMADYFKKAL
jgi:hypothetical protein